VLPPERQRPLRDAVARAERDMTTTRASSNCGTRSPSRSGRHSLDRVTDMDVELARRIDAAVAALGSSG
jgi:hypothetical protein